MTGPPRGALSCSLRSGRREGPAAGATYPDSRTAEGPGATARTRPAGQARGCREGHQAWAALGTAQLTHVAPVAWGREGLLLKSLPGNHGSPTKTWTSRRFAGRLAGKQGVWAAPGVWGGSRPGVSFPCGPRLRGAEGEALFRARLVRAARLWNSASSPWSAGSVSCQTHLRHPLGVDTVTRADGYAALCVPLPPRNLTESSVTEGRPPPAAIRHLFC